MESGGPFLRGWYHFSPGYTTNIDCSDAIFDVKSTVSQFVEHSNCVYAAALDLKKAFDRVNHFKLFSTLIGFWCPYPSR